MMISVHVMLKSLQFVQLYAVSVMAAISMIRFYIMHLNKSGVFTG